MANSFYHYQSRAQLERVLKVAALESPADLLLKGGQVLDVVNGEFKQWDIAIVDGMIAGVGKGYKAERIIECQDKFLVPGFINSHLHIESSLMHPFEFERVTLPMGTTTAICDPHEIVNVLGKSGLEWFLRCAELMHQNLYVQISSCVPALPGMETNGGEFDLEQMKEFVNHPHSLGMAEMMNFPGVVNGDPQVLDKLEIFQRAGLGVDGHAPLVQGDMLNGYIAAGVRNCHESVTLEEAKEKLAKGMAVMIREGSVAKNLHTLAPLINEMNSINTLLCTDDRNPFDLYEQGELTYMLRILINEFSIRPELAFRVASLSAANHFRLDHLGMIAPGKQADIVMLSDIHQVEIADTLIRGELVSELNLADRSHEVFKSSNPPLENSIKRDMTHAAEFVFKSDVEEIPCIEIIEHEIITTFSTCSWSGDGFVQQDIALLAVVERYGKQRPITLAPVRGFSLERGAIASSVAHDSHNIVVVGRSAQEMARAVNHLIGLGGGFCVVDGEDIRADLALPLAGLISLKSAEEIYYAIKQLKEAASGIGCSLSEPFLQLAFLALPVIPELKLTDRGLFDVRSFKYI